MTKKYTILPDQELSDVFLEVHVIKKRRSEINDQSKN